MEPPSPILMTSNVEADAMSDDPLSNCIFVILGSTSDSEEGSGRHAVCAYTAHAGLLYIGTAGDILS